MIPSDASLSALYGAGDKLTDAKARYTKLAERFAAAYPGREPRFFSSPGRTEIGGNHTDHQHGRVIAASVDLDTIAAAAPNAEGIVRVDSEGFAPFAIDLSDTSVRASEEGTTASIIRGCAARMAELGYPVGGFDAVMSSRVFSGSGLSSSAAFEVLVCTILDCLYGQGQMDPVERAKISQYAENVYFGKPSGLMDQTASSVGGIVTIDFREVEAPEVSALGFDFAAHGYTLAVVNTGGSHDDLTDAYAAIRHEMEQVAAQFGEKCLRGVDPAAFEAAIPDLRGHVSDRAILRSLHFFDENARVPEMVAALESLDLQAFFRLIIASGESSWKLLQNVWAAPQEQPLALALELSRRMLEGKGAWRVHGGGFAGTILAFVPTDMMEEYAQRMDAVFEKGACCPLDIRPVGPCEVR